MSGTDCSRAAPDARQILLLVLVLLTLGAGCRADTGSTEAIRSGHPQVTVTPVTFRDLSVLLPVSGVLGALPGRDVKLGPLAPGRLVALAVAEGDRVVEGQLLARLDPAPLGDALRQAEATLAEAEATARKSIAGRLVREERLYALGISAGQEVDDARAQAAGSVARAATARAELHAARDRLSTSELRAPFDGVVVQVMAAEGEPIDANKPVVEVARLDVLELRAVAPAVDLARVREGMPASVTVEGVASRVPAEVIAVSPGVEPTTGAGVLRLRLANPGPLRLGQLGTALVVLESRARSPAVPVSALVPRPGDAAGRLSVVVVESGSQGEVPARGARGQRRGLDGGARGRGGGHAGDQQRRLRPARRRGGPGDGAGRVALRRRPGERPVTFTGLALRHGVAVVFVAVALSAAGLDSARRLPKGVYPELTFPREQVVATLPGASSESVMAALTRPLEEALSSIPGTVRVRSRTLREATLVSLDFSPHTDMAQANALVLARLAELRSGLPAQATLTAEQVLPSGFPILSFNITGPHPPERLYEVAQYVLRPALSGLPGRGVGLGPVLRRTGAPGPPGARAPRRGPPHRPPGGGPAAQGECGPDRGDPGGGPRAVAGRGDRGAPRRASALPGGGGKLACGRTAARGGPGDGEPGVQPRTSLIRVDGEPGVILNVARRPGGDILVLHEAVMKRLETLAPSLPPGISLRPAYAQAVFVDEAVRGVRDAVLLGVLLVVGVLASFLRDWRATLLASLSLPLTLGISLLILEALGETLNLMTLGGLAVAVGLVIDDAVVVIEAIHRHHLAGASPAAASRKGVEELLWPVVGTTLTTVVVFLPLGLLGGVAGAFFISLSIALSAAVLLSLPVALVVLPVLAARLLRSVVRADRPFFLVGPYQRALRWTLERRRLTRWVPLLAVGVAALVLTRVDTGFLPEADEGAYILDYFAPVAASLSEANAMAIQVEAILRETPEVATFSRRLGTELGPATATLSSSGDIAVRLRSDRSRGIEEIMDEQRSRSRPRFPGCAWSSSWCWRTCSAISRVRPSRWR